MVPAYCRAEHRRPLAPGAVLFVRDAPPVLRHILVLRICDIGVQWRLADWCRSRWLRVHLSSRVHFSLLFAIFIAIFIAILT
jgi:hypothetical protein